MGVSGGAYWCVVMKRGDVVFCRFVGRRFWGNGERRECVCVFVTAAWATRYVRLCVRVFVCVCACACACTCACACVCVCVYVVCWGHVTSCPL